MLVRSWLRPLALHSFEWVTTTTPSAAVRPLLVSWSRLGAQSIRIRS